MNELKKIDKILIMNLGGMGDLLLSIPAIRSLKKLYPQSQISLLTVDRSKEVGFELPFIDRVLAIPYKTQIYRGLNFIFGPWEFAKTLLYFHNLRKEHFYLMVNFRTIDSFASALKTALVFYLVGAKFKAGRDTEGRGFFYDKRIFEPFSGKKSEIEYDLDVISSFGGDTGDKSIQITIKDEAVNQVRDILRNAGVDINEELIAIAPGAPWPAKRWNIENFISVAKSITQKARKILVIGSTQEINLCKQLADETLALNLAGMLNFRQLKAVISLCSLFITNDTGVMHLAAAIRCPMVALIGPGDLTRYYPAGDKEKIVVLHHPLDCSPCFKYDCNSKRCLTSVTPEEVVTAAEGLLTMLKKSPFHPPL